MINKYQTSANAHIKAIYILLLLAQNSLNKAKPN